MLYPSIDKLMDKVDSKYKLVTVAAKRARKLQEKEGLLIDKPVSHKFVGKALEEISAGELLIRVDDTKSPEEMAEEAKL
ncbi:DNA-directed RNA polymerase subunit omega [Bacillus suaedaesalsae]|uniref:DNA-directed RNA polymerase subunit omega n=1 Tax=Bacillus suaedaesalsae TaxID=2810349 RepID=A0ABS2DJ32_9BACI|nr:DNA-directed RNA polymerase subunit omega [Bacillus suaedaesalsae]MBM6618501.1 DNA-directed RNA polymerase subunit omega [Bacillus suaedaesalsae]